MGRRIGQRLIQVVGGILLVYGAFLVGIFAAMHQPVERFGRIMSYMPGPLFMIIPFEPMWNIARAGQLDVGYPAPDFALGGLDSKGRPMADGQIRLSSFRGRQPVVLVFGSYT
jgi:hypothetical protein